MHWDGSIELAQLSEISWLYCTWGGGNWDSHSPAVAAGACPLCAHGKLRSMLADTDRHCLPRAPCPALIGAIWDSVKRDSHHHTDHALQEMQCTACRGVKDQGRGADALLLCAMTHRHNQANHRTGMCRPASPVAEEESMRLAQYWLT